MYILCQSYAQASMPPSTQPHNYPKYLCLLGLPVPLLGYVLTVCAFLDKPVQSRLSPASYPPYTPEIHSHTPKPDLRDLTLRDMYRVGNGWEVVFRFRAASIGCVWPLWDRDVVSVGCLYHRSHGGAPRRRLQGRNDATSARRRSTVAGLLLKSRGGLDSGTAAWAVSVVWHCSISAHMFSARRLTDQSIRQR